MNLLLQRERELAPGERYMATYSEATRLERRAYLKEMPKKGFDGYL